MGARPKSKIASGDRTVAFYHIISRDEGFDKSAQALFQLVQGAQKRYPGKKRKLFLDIEGHRDRQGGFDADMIELQQEFLLGFLGRFLSEIHCPLISVTKPKGQEDDIPPALVIREAGQGE